jgi:hypothetical protein
MFCGYRTSSNSYSESRRLVHVSCQLISENRLCAKCASAANLACRDVDIVLKHVFPLNQISHHLFQDYLQLLPFVSYALCASFCVIVSLPLFSDLFVPLFHLDCLVCMCIIILRLVTGLLI